MGRDGVATMEITKRLLVIVINNQYWLYLGNESIMISRFFDTGFVCDGNLYTSVDIVRVSASITVFCVFFCSLFVPEHYPRVPVGSTSENL